MDVIADPRNRLVVDRFTPQAEPSTRPAGLLLNSSFREAKFVAQQAAAVGQFLVLSIGSVAGGFAGAAYADWEIIIREPMPLPARLAVASVASLVSAYGAFAAVEASGKRAERQVIEIAKRRNQAHLAASTNG